ncbi:MAG: histidinol dehydrogenase [Parvularculales bacterium]
MVQRLSTADTGFEDSFTTLMGKRETQTVRVEEQVAAIIADVRQRGDTALLEYTARFDGQAAADSGLVIGSREIEAASGACEAATLEALNLAATRIRTFHERQCPVDDYHVDELGVKLGQRWTAVDAAGLYAPGGTASYPSSVLMNAIPAQVAGVNRRIMVTPAPQGTLNPLVLAAAHLSSIDELYRVGGAHAIAALAFGTETITPVDVITGPGNAYVAEAKRQVFGAVGIDSIAGPSEILVVADGHNDPAWIAADLVAQAEHDVTAQSILITDDETFTHLVEAAVAAQLETLPRRMIAQASWSDFGAIIQVRSLAESTALVNRLAPEHLSLAIEEPEGYLEHIHHAGAIFVGRYTPEAVGDYIAGPNHVLPTARAARFSSALAVTDFMKRSSVIHCSAENLSSLAPAVISLAQAEGLEAHARSISVRLNNKDGTS